MRTRQQSAKCAQEKWRTDLERQLRARATDRLQTADGTEFNRRKG